MVTFLTTLKPFRGDDAVRQCNALISWLAVVPGAEGHGLRPRARGSSAGPNRGGCDITLRYPCVDDRVPLVGPMFEIAQREGKHDLQAYVNGDTMLFPDFYRAVKSVPGGAFPDDR